MGDLGTDDFTQMNFRSVHRRITLEQADRLPVEPDDLAAGPADELGVVRMVEQL